MSTAKERAPIPLLAKAGSLLGANIMGGLFGGSSKEESGRILQELSPPADTSGSNIPGDDKIRAARNVRLRHQQAIAAEDKTLLGQAVKGGNKAKEVSYG